MLLCIGILFLLCAAGRISSSTTVMLLLHTRQTQPWDGARGKDLSSKLVNFRRNFSFFTAKMVDHSGNGVMAVCYACAHVCFPE